MIEKINNSVSIIVSGGADSALLLYFLLKVQTDTVHIKTLTNKQKFYRNVLPAVNIVKFCSEKTNNNNITHTFLYEDFQDNKSFDKLIQSIDTKIKIMGVTDVPSADSDLDIPTLPENDIRNNPKPRDVWQGDWFFPFANLNKREIAELYKNNDLLETLFPLTMSCESLENVDGHCGECWWCKERIWGFGRLV